MAPVESARLTHSCWRPESVVGSLYGRTSGPRSGKYQRICFLKLKLYMFSLRIYNESKLPISRSDVKYSCFKEGLILYLVILATGAKTKDEKVSMGVCGCKMLPIWTAFTVKQRSMPLALDLSTQTNKSLNHTIGQAWQFYGMEIHEQTL